MSREFWQRQTREKPLFPELAWSRPENKQRAGKLLIAGGNAYGFAAPGEAYNQAVKAGIGTARVLLPDALQKAVGPLLASGEFAPCTPSGSFSQKALGAFLEFSAWGDGVLLAGDLGRNSETAILLEKFLSKSQVAVSLTKDAVDYAVSAPQIVLQRPNTLLVLSLSQLQRLGTAAKSERPVTFGMDLLHLVDWLHDFTTRFQPFIIVKHLENMFVAADGQVSTTKLEQDQKIWRLETAAHAAVWWLQSLGKPFAALSTSVIKL